MLMLLIAVVLMKRHDSCVCPEAKLWDHLWILLTRGKNNEELTPATIKEHTRYIHNVKNSGDDYNSNSTSVTRRRLEAKVHFISDKERWNSDSNEAITTYNGMGTTVTILTQPSTNSAKIAEQGTKEYIYSTNKQLMEIDRNSVILNLK
jgi:hypothetical protein